MCPLRHTQTRAKYLWWGRYLTQFQMAQFLANLVQARQRSLRACAAHAVLTLRCPPGIRLRTACATRRTRASCPTCCCGTCARCSSFSVRPHFARWAARQRVRADARLLLPRAAGSFYYSKHVAPKKGAAAKGGKKRQ